MLGRLALHIYKIVECLYNWSNIYFVARQPHVLGNLSSTRNKTTLEIGCGDRILWTQRLADRSRLVVAMDIDEQKISTARRLGRRPHSKLDNVAWIVGDATSLPFKAEAFESVTCIDVIEHIPDHKQAIREVARVTVQGGDVVLTTMRENRRHYIRPLVFANHVREYTWKSLEQVCQSDPLRVVKRFSFYKPLTTALRELQLLVLPRVDFPLVNLLINLPLGVLGLIGELDPREGGGIGIVMRRNQAKSAYASE
ncbi:MAG: class I SAM-dependent methyltransferase [Anaerolineae bacterium]|nr:class I SAM-dependent methyltransferase [Anaerolineae bacterium]